jgi:hypothetical protein
VSDGLSCFRGVTEAGCTHQPIPTGSGRTAAQRPAFKWVNTALGNIKTAMTGTYRAIRHKHVPRYLAEFEYRPSLTVRERSWPGAVPQVFDFGCFCQSGSGSRHSM